MEMPVTTSQYLLLIKPSNMVTAKVAVAITMDIQMRNNSSMAINHTINNTLRRTNSCHHHSNSSSKSYMVTKLRLGIHPRTTGKVAGMQVASIGGNKANSCQKSYYYLCGLSCLLLYASLCQGNVAFKKKLVLFSWRTMLLVKSFLSFLHSNN
jgi:hypothetical protein